MRVQAHIWHINHRDRVARTERKYHFRVTDEAPEFALIGLPHRSRLYGMLSVTLRVNANTAATGDGQKINAGSR